MEYKKIKVEKDERVARIKIANPPVNVLDMETMKEIISAIDEVEGVDVIVFLEKGRALVRELR